MTKRSKRRSSRHERDQAGCISGFINIFHFREGRSTKRLLTDRKQAVGAGHSSNNTISPSPIEKCEILADTEESKVPLADAAKTSVKELMEEEMFNEQGLKQPNDFEMGIDQVDSKSGNHIKKHHKKKRSSAMSSDMDFEDNLDLERILKELANINQRNTNSLTHNFNANNDIATSGEAVTVVEEKLVQAVKLFIERRLSNSKRFGEERNNRCSEELMDALRTLSLNKGLSLKLLQDPNSELVKQVQNFEDARLGKDQTVNLKSDELSSHKHRNFFRRRSKSLESFPVGGDNKDYQSPNKIVILKPGPTGSRSPGTDFDNNKLHNEKNTSQFSFTEIKRKLRHAMGKERQGPSLKYSPKPQSGNNFDKGENFGWRSPNLNHFYTERFTLSSPSFKKGETVSKLKEDGSESARLGGASIYIEAKKHISEMVKSGDENPESTAGQSVKPLGRILSLPEYSNSSPCLSPGKHGDDVFVAAQMRLSPRGPLKNNPSPRMENLKSQPCIPGGNSEDKVLCLKKNDNNSVGDDHGCYLEIECFSKDSIVPEVLSKGEEIEQPVESRPQDEESIIDISSESSNNSTGEDIQNGDTREVGDEESATRCFISHLHGDDQVLSPSMSPSLDRASTVIDDSDRAIEKIEQPSPISVLEPLFTDDDITPASTISHPVEKEIQPRQIHFEEQSSVNDQGICTRISLEDEESAFEYVEAVLLGSGLNWDEFLLRWVCTYEILDSSLFDEVELFSSRPHHDQKLLFDSANDALKEICESYFGCFSGISSFNPNIRPIPKGMDLIHEVWKRVEMRLFQNLQSHSLDRLVKRDLAGSKRWMKIELDIELVAFNMEEIIFDELVDEIVLSFGDDILESEFDVLRDEAKANEDTNLCTV